MFTSEGPFGAPEFPLRTIPFGGGRPGSLAARWALVLTQIGPPGDGFGLDVLRLLDVDIFRVKNCTYFLVQRLSRKAKATAF